MKRTYLLSLFSVALAFAAQAQQLFYENDGVVSCPPELPPQIDAVNFVNRGTFNINFTNLTINSQLFDTSDTLNFTNYGTMFGSPGFEFMTAPINSGAKRMAANIHNEGSVTAGTSSNLIISATGGFGVFVIAGLPKLIASATNFVNHGDINMGFESVCSINAHNLDFQYGSLTMMDNGNNSINGSIFFNGGLFDGYWGLGTNLMNPAGQIGAVPPQSTLGFVTNRNYLAYYQRLVLPNALVYLDDQTIGSNRTVRAVFLSNTNADLQAKVYLPYQGFPYYSAVEWSLPTTNAFGVVSTNYLYLLDYFGVDPTFGLFLNGFAGAGLNRATYQPANYFFFQTANPLFFFEPPATPTIIPGGTFNNSIVTNQYTAYQALFLPTSLVLSDTANQDVTNLPGRVTISADKVLDLTGARISSLNYLGVSSPNSFAGSERAKISSPYSDLILRNTNGLMTITNMMTPSLPRPEGTIDCFSLRWTNDVAGVTNTYHVLYVDTRLAPLTPTRVQDLVLRVTNSTGSANSLFIKDVMNVTRSLLLDCTDLTISTNEPGSPADCGALNVVNQNIVWPNSTPRLQNLTNDGVIQTYNAVFFGGARTSPYYSSTFNEPYMSFINRGTVTNYGSLIWTKYFQNSGRFNANSGGIKLMNCESALLTNGTFMAQDPYGYIQLEAGSIFVSNHLFRTAGALTLRATNSLDDSSLGTSVALITNKNAWTVGNGINLPILPARSSLAATTITNLSTSFHPVPNTWAAADRGTSPAGFTNNAAIGRLILDGRDKDSQFTFASVGAASAMYVDYLDLRGSVATNVDGLGNFVGVKVFPGMKIYYGQAVANGISVAEKLNGRPGFSWVSNYNTGFYSSTNVVYPDGSTNQLNAALVASCDIDSNGNGIVNCMDPAPIPVFSSASLALSARILAAAPRSAAISWNSLPNASNYLYSASSARGDNWQLVTNFVSGPSGGRVTVADPVQTNAVRFYKVRIGN